MPSSKIKKIKIIDLLWKNYFRDKLPVDTKDFVKQILQENKVKTKTIIGSKNTDEQALLELSTGININETTSSKEGTVTSVLQPKIMSGGMK